MPIKPENRSRYPKNWPEIVAGIRERAKNRCEVCGVQNYLVIKRLRSGWRTPGPQEWEMIHAKLMYGNYTMSQSLKFHGFVRIICTTAHLDHQPENCDPANLKFLCQKCHNNYDKAHRVNTRRAEGLKNQMSLSFNN